ncbi:MAG: serine hydrolase [Candidatus Heimdallarchaeota archaeon]|nr:MAG: serine hydrolase [Candidatus Heimdallarchaeota archaeon]
MKNSFVEITEDFIETLESLISEEMVRHKVPGASIAIVKNDQIIYQESFGARDLEGNLPATPITLFNIASCTKSIICLAIMKLEEQGKLDRHDPISKYIPCKLGFTDDPITIHHLMAHTSGIPEIVGGIAHLDLAMEAKIEVPFIPFMSWNDFFRHINGASEYVSERPGNRFYYQNYGYTMLGRIIEVVSGDNLPNFIKKSILSPLQMKQSTFLKEELDKLEEVSLAYKMSDQEKRIEKTSYYRENEQFGYAPGGLFSSVVELANLIIMYLQRGRYQGTEIIQSDKIDAMFTRYFKEIPNSQLYSPTIGHFGEAGYGYGLAIHEDFFGQRLVHHSGSWIGASAWVAMLPELHLGVVFLSNKHPSPRMLALSTLAMLIGVDVKKEFPLFRSRDHLEKLAGEYELYKGVGKMKLTTKGGLLFYKFDYWGIDAPLIPLESDNDVITLSYYLLTEVGGKDPIEFEIDEKGTIWMHHERLKWKKVRDL